MPDSARYWPIPIADPIIGATLQLTHVYNTVGLHASQVRHQIVNPIIATVDPDPFVLYTRKFIFVNLLIANVGKTHNSQLLMLRYSPQKRTSVHYQGFPTH